MKPTLDVLLDKLPPSNLEKNLQWFRNHLPKQKQCLSVNESNKQSYQQHYLPFQLINNSSEDGERPFLICSYNDVGSGKYRSPWTNRLYHWSKDCQLFIAVQSGEKALDTSAEKLR
jgi:hypothetical protein